MSIALRFNKEVVMILENLVSGNLRLYFLSAMTSLLFSNGLLPKEKMSKSHSF